MRRLALLPVQLLAELLLDPLGQAILIAVVLFAIYHW